MRSHMFGVFASHNPSHYCDNGWARIHTLGCNKNNDMFCLLYLQLPNKIIWFFIERIQFSWNVKIKLR